MASRKAFRYAPLTEDVIAVIQRMRKGTRFTTDNLWPKVDIEMGLDPRVMGGALHAARNLKLIEATGEYRKSFRSACHNRPVAVWERI